MTKEQSTKDSNATTEISAEVEQAEDKNKGGRPKGRKNNITLLQEAAHQDIMEEVLTNFDKVVKTTIEKAEEGDSTCLKILWDRIIPARKAVEAVEKKGNQGVTIIVQGTAQAIEGPVIDIPTAEIIGSNNQEVENE